MSQSKLFSKEEEILRHCEEMLRDNPSADEAFNSAFAKLVSSYRRLMKQSSRLVRVSDRQQQDLRHLTQLKDHFIEELERLSLTDGLTGVANRRRFDAFIEHEWRRGARLKRPMAILLIDVDDFKRFNDNYGHAAGDECLRQVAQVLSRVNGRPTDLFARYGGEEFAAVLSETGAAGALQVARDMVEAVRSLSIPHAHSRAADFVTISMGIGVMEPSGDRTPHDLVCMADDALYQAKENGRNRCFPGSPEALQAGY